MDLCLVDQGYEGFIKNFAGFTYFMLWMPVSASQNS